MEMVIKNWGSRWVFSKRYQKALVRPKGSAKMAPPRLCSFSENISVASGCVANLKCAPQVEVPVKINRCFSQKDWRCVLVWYLWSALGGDSLPRIVSSIISELWGPETQSSLATKARQSRGFPYVGYTYLLALAWLWRWYGSGVYPSVLAG